MFRFLKRFNCKHPKERLISQWYEGENAQILRRSWKCLNCGRVVTRPKMKRQHK